MAGAARIIPAKLDEKTTEKIQELAKQTFRALLQVVSQELIF